VAYLTNTGGRRVRAESAAVLDDLAQAVARPVQWYDAMRLMSELGAKRAVQMPPGLEASREYGTEVEWQFSFTVVSPGGTAVDTAR
jgi:hypothetical protein